MVNPELFIKTLLNNGIDFFTGVPDSLLKNICAYITDNIDESNHVIAANEGNAVGLASGYHLSTGKIAMVYMQNSGEGNVINPLLSLADDKVYGIPMLLLIGWRGEPGVYDEPQHIKQGKVTLDLLDAMQIAYNILSDNDSEVINQLNYAKDYMKLNKCPYVLIVKKGTFGEYRLKNVEETDIVLSREEAIKTVVDCLEQTDIVVSTTGMISRELFEYRESQGQGHTNDFLTVGSMGHANQIALGIAIQKKDRRIFCFDGDGALLMHLGGMAIIGNIAPQNYIHIVFNNGAHDSVGGQPTVGQKINLTAIAGAMGYKSIYSVFNIEELQCTLSCILGKQIDGPIFINVNVKKGNRKDLGRPTITPKQNKEFFMNNLK